MSERANDFVLVHGAWCTGWVWEGLVERLEKAGQRVSVVELPSSGTDPAALGDLAGDAELVRGVLDRLDGPVVLVGHSYGGMVITELAAHPKVRHSVYVTAFWPDRGQSLLNLLGDPEQLVEWIVPRNDGTSEITSDLDIARAAVCADLDPDRGREFLSHTVLQSLAAFVAPSTAPEREHPTTFVVTTQEPDDAIAVTLQERMAAKADNVIRLASAHMVQLSHPDELAEALLGV